MSGFFNTKGNMGFLKERFNRNLSAGEKLVGAEFWMDIHGYENISVLIRSVQVPEMGREDIEDFAPMGVKFNQHGTIKNSGEITVACVETLDGKVYAAVLDLVRNKRYVDITIRTTAESSDGSTPDSLIRKLSHCKVYCEQVDLSTEDTTALVKPSLRIVYNWVE